jgi:hypothetical protein
MWQGVTEGSLERVLNLLKAMSPIALSVANTGLRGKVIWFLLTCRPDFPPVDLKRRDARLV